MPDGYVGAMDFDERTAAEFLAEPHVGILAVGSPSGPPAAVPLWYAYTVGGRIWIITEATSRKRRVLARTGCATLVVDEVAPRTRYVSVDCELVDARPATAEDQRELASPYVPADALEAYLATVDASWCYCRTRATSVLLDAGPTRREAA